MHGQESGRTAHAHHQLVLGSRRDRRQGDNEHQTHTMATSIGLAFTPSRERFDSLTDERRCRRAETLSAYHWRTEN